MRASSVGLLLAVLALTGCESRFNPVNWFGASTPQVPAQTAEVAARVNDPRPLIAQVTAMTIEQTPNGAIVRATGVAATQGYFAAELVPEARAPGGGPAPVDGAITYRFVVVPPPTPQPVGPVRTREISVAAFLSDQQLAGVRSITVTGAQSARSVRR